MDVSDIIQLRLANQQITSTNYRKPEEIVKHLGAMQAQEFAQSKWAIGLRLPGINDADVKKAFTEGNIIRTHILRPTWHFVSPDDIRWMLSLSAPRVKANNAFMYRKMELDNRIFGKTNNIIIKALRGNKQLTRTDLASEMHRKKIDTDGIRLSLIMMQAELDGIICSGARNGNQFTYALLDERVPPSKPIKEDEALSALTKRYFNSRGPATLKDFSTWSGLSITQARKGIAMVEGDFDHVKIDSSNFYFPAISSTKILSKEVSPGQNIHLLPIYDEYIMGYKDRSFYLDSKYRTHPSSIFTFDNTIILKGKILGTWRRTFNKKVIDLEYNLLKPLSKTGKKDFMFEVDRFSKFTGWPVNLRQKK